MPFHDLNRAGALRGNDEEQVFHLCVDHGMSSRLFKKKIIFDYTNSLPYSLFEYTEEYRQKDRE